MKRIFSLVACSSAILWIAAPASAQNDNPTGKAGIFNGNSNTSGVSFDPYTSNTTRTIFELSVPGAVGSYGLQWTRTMNSRYTEGPNYNFGSAGSWQHAYNWGIDWMADVEAELGDNISSIRAPGPGRPVSYTVYYPDGRVVEFAQRPNSIDPVYRGPTGVTDRFQSLVGNGYCYLLRSNGGKVQFQQFAFFDARAREWQFSITPVAMIDPYGLSTTLTYGGPNSKLSQVTEPGGRWLKINYVTAFGNQVIGSVQAGYGVNTVTQSVTYSYQQFTAGPYSYTTLTGASYSDGTSAAYTYQPANTYPGTAPPLIQTCDDVRSAGPMKKIAYEFVAQPAENQGGVYGEFATARKWLYTDPFVVSYVLSTHTERRGDGPQRSFTYGPGDATDEDSLLCVPQAYLLGSYTDFKGNLTTQCYDTNAFLAGVRDANGNPTSFTRTSLTGKLLTVTHPPDATGAYSTIHFSYTDPVTAYYLQSVTDELQHTTVFQRDANNRIKEINYPDTASETFIYNNFGQVTTHRMTSGGTEAFEYDARGRLERYRDPYHQTGNPTARYQYDSMDRISGVTDPRGGYTGDPNYTTNYEHNQRGQLTKITHPNDPVTPTVRYTEVNEYNNDATLRSVTDESGHATTYGYDDYKRLSSITAPPAYNGDATPRTTYFYYDKTGGTNADFTHTDSNVTNVTTPLGNTVKTLYDENFWKRSVTAGTEAEAATTSYTYDAVGNLKTLKDPNGQSTGAYTEYFYDKRNRLTDVNDPLPSDRNSLGHTISWTYDQVGNKKSQLRANDQLVAYDQYDPMNRLQVQSVQRDVDAVDQTVMTYDSAGNLATFTDGRQKQYSYRYDFLNRRTATTYPKDDAGISREETYHYDYANNLDSFTNRDGALQTFEYDNRNRQTHYYWNTWPQYTLYERWLSYDERSNLRTVRSSLTDPTDNDVMSYDWRNRKTSETQTNAGRPSRTIGYTYDADSNRKTLTYPAGYQLTYNYNSRNHLREEVDSSGAVVTYVYDLSGNRTRRDLRNGTFSQYSVDPLDRPYLISHNRGSTEFAEFRYGYDTVSRMTSIRRDSGWDDKYDYYLDDQLKSAEFDTPWYDYLPSPPREPANTTSLAYDANGNRTSQTNTATPNYTYTVNDLNQYNSVNGAAPSYDAAGNLSQYDGWTYGYNRQNRLTDAEKGGTGLYFWYDGLNRQILRYENNQWIYSVWDGWDLLEEYDINGQLIHSYVHGGAVDELISRSDSQPGSNRIWYYQDAQGNTTQLASDSGNVIERYKYDPALAGTPSVFAANGQQITNSAYDNRFLYTGREYYKDVGIYDYRNRFYLPSLGRFLQPDPIGFAGDSNNLYRYCGNDPTNSGDPSGLDQYSFSVGAGPAVMITWGTNGPSQRNFGIYVGIGAGLSASYTPSDSGYAFPQVVPGIAGQYNWGAGRFMSVNVSVLNTTEGGTATATAGIGYKSFERQVGVTIDPSKSPPYNAAPATYSYLNGIFVGIGGTSYGAPQVPAPGGTTDIDPKICPECATTERVTVYGSAVPQPTYLAVGRTYFDASGSPFHLGTTGNLINGPAFTVTKLSNLFPGLTSAGGGDWQGVIPWEIGGQPGEGTHPVTPDLN